MDVIAYRRAVRGRIVGTEDLQHPIGLGERAQRQRDQVRLGGVALAVDAVCTGSVEVAQADRGESMSPGERRDHQICRNLRGAVRALRDGTDWTRPAGRERPARRTPHRWRRRPARARPSPASTPAARASRPRCCRSSARARSRTRRPASAPRSAAPPRPRQRAPRAPPRHQRCLPRRGAPTVRQHPRGPCSGRPGRRPHDRPRATVP